MIATSLFVAFLLAKVLALWGRPLPLPAWAPVAFLWQDAAVAIVFYVLFERILRKQWILRVVYGSVIMLAAVNIPVMRVLSAPLTAPMLRAARRTLSASIGYHATASNLSAVALLIAIGLLLPKFVRWLRRSSGPGANPAFAPTLWLGFGALLLLFGPLTQPPLDTAALEQNVVVALLRTSVPRVRASAVERDWRAPEGTGRVMATEPNAKINADRADLAALRGAASGRNVLLVILESTAAQYLRPYGAAQDPMPTLTALAKRAFVFENAYAVYPESVKGLVVMLASRYPGFDVSAERHAPIVSTSLASVLAGAGYETALFHSGRFMYLGMEALVTASGFHRVADAGDIGGNQNSSFGVEEPSTVQAILRWIDSRPPTRPFFVTYLPIAGHHPYTSSVAAPFPPGEEIGRYRSALYEADLALSHLLGGLEARGLAGSTLIVVVADHGEAFGQHPGNYGHTLALYEENVHVPLLVLVPSVAAGSSRVSRVASLVDLGPTVLDLLGLSSPDAFQGESLLRSRERVALFFTDYSLGLVGLRDGCYKYVGELQSRRQHLFDVCRDTAEVTDVASSEAVRVRHYRQRLHQWLSAQVQAIARPPHLPRAATRLSFQR